MADPCIGCGFEIDGVTGDLLLLGPREEAWPYSGDISDCNGMACDPNTDEVWAPPEHDLVVTGSSVGAPVNFQAQFGFVYRWDIDTASLAANPASPWNTPGADITTTASITLTNPSGCRDMLYWVGVGVGAITTTLDSNVAVSITAAIQVDGGGYAAYGFTNTLRGDNTVPLTLDQIANQNSVLPSDPFLPTALSLPPGGSVDLDVKLVGAGSNYTATVGQQVIIGAGITLHAWGQTL